jgi:hypothetical protein
MLAAIQSRTFCLLICCRKKKLEILPVVLYGCEIWSLTLRENNRPRLFENKLLRGIFGLKRVEVTGGGEKSTKRSFVICTLRQV